MCSPPLPSAPPQASIPFRTGMVPFIIAWNSPGVGVLRVSVLSLWLCTVPRLRHGEGVLSGAGASGEQCSLGWECWWGRSSTTVGSSPELPVWDTQRNSFGEGRQKSASCLGFAEATEKAQELEVLCGCEQRGRVGSCRLRGKGSLRACAHGISSVPEYGLL